MDYFEEARINMVKNQIIPNNVSDERVLEAFFEVSRHLFTESNWQEVAYSDRRIPLDNDKNRFLLQPELLARMIDALKLTGTETVLDIGCSSGYSTAVLSRLAKYVIGVENIKSLALKAANNLTFMNLHNIAIKEGELFAGDPASAPYDAILINGAVIDVPKSLIDQIAVGGRLVVVQKVADNLGKVVRIENHAGSIGKVDLFDRYTDLL
jgi:protein-L-isoaspartate(D-aspartate) O-methyltransferase